MAHQEEKMNIKVHFLLTLKQLNSLNGKTILIPTVQSRQKQYFHNPGSYVNAKCRAEVLQALGTNFLPIVL